MTNESTTSNPASRASVSAAAARAAPVIAVKALCEFAVKRGDLDLRFTPSPSAREGIAAHQWVQRKRGKNYEAELRVQGVIGGLLLSGRADGYDTKKNQLEEIKTRLGPATRVPEHHSALHWAQAKIYAALLCQARGLLTIKVAIVYIDYLTLKETVLVEECNANELLEQAQILCQAYINWAQSEALHREARNTWLMQLEFPFKEFRAGQREISRAVYASATKPLTDSQYSKHLLIQAPTGLGKTLASLYGQLRAMPSANLDKIYYLTPKSSTKQLAWEGLAKLTQLHTRPLRVIEIVAKDKACEHPESACHPDSCPLARGFYDRLPAARLAALQALPSNPQRIRDTATQHQVCPYFLTQELVRWADVVIGDYNYFFDASAMLYGLAHGLDWRVGLLLDEAHNLVERTRSMYSASLNQGTISKLKRSAPRSLRNAFSLADRQWRKVNTSTASAELLVVSARGQPIEPALLDLLKKLVKKIAAYFVEHPAEHLVQLRDFMFEVQHWLALAETIGPAYFWSLRHHAAAGVFSQSIDIHCVVPAGALYTRWALPSSVVLFSATLTPVEVEQQLLGLDTHSIYVQANSPYDPKQLQVKHAKGLSTKFHERAGSLSNLAQIIANQFKEKPGNYLAFFSSYTYLDQVVTTIRTLHPELPLLVQTPRMTEPEQAHYLGRFEESSQVIGFAVLGGAFAEGIDLPGRRLCGAFIATLGMAPVGPINERMREVLESLVGNGFEHCYLYPGLRKVVQAAGRVIRSETDEGIVWLLDERFMQEQTRALLPSWWQIESS
jgi:DNA excision repair protein ERCC-2